jgi:hypothetical protein
MYKRVADNLCAIAATFEAMRAIERHGGAQVQERTFRGFLALPASTGKRPWRQVLELDGQSVNREVIQERYLKLAKQRHPDWGGDQQAMSELNTARDEALREYL